MLTYSDNKVPEKDISNNEESEEEIENGRFHSAEKRGRQLMENCCILLCIEPSIHPCAIMIHAYSFRPILTPLT